MPQPPEAPSTLENATVGAADTFLQNKQQGVNQAVESYFERGDLGPRLAAAVEDLLQF